MPRRLPRQMLLRDLERDFTVARMLLRALDERDVSFAVCACLSWELRPMSFVLRGWSVSRIATC